MSPLTLLAPHPLTASAGPTCRGCGARLARTLIDLGDQPLANSYVRPQDADRPQPAYPLHAQVCDACLLVQVDDVVPADSIFNERYPYFSSFSPSWLDHCRDYVAAMTDRFGLTRDSMVIEIASNDGYMLQYFVERGIPVLGIEPAANTAEVAIARGVPTETVFFNLETARRLAEGRRPDLLAAKNVLAHVPDINDFAAAIACLLKPEGVFTVEFPHLLNLIRNSQFDTIYHEHYTYLSLHAVKIIFERQGLRVFDVEEQPTHGGSLRLFACATGASHATLPSVAATLAGEVAAGLDRPEGYDGFDAQAERVRRDLNAFLAEARAVGKSIAAYGAAAKGNTLFNYCGITAADVAYVVDRNPAKRGMLMPGSHIPIHDPAALEAAPPDYLLILPWNLRDEIVAQNAGLRAHGTRFVTAIPELAIF